MRVLTNASSTDVRCQFDWPARDCQPEPKSSYVRFGGNSRLTGRVAHPSFFHSYSTHKSGCPILRVFCEGWVGKNFALPREIKFSFMAKLIRFHKSGGFHFITFSCYRRQPMLNTATAYRVFEQEFEAVRCRYGFVIAGYVLMPEHVHLLVGEPVRSSLSIALQVLKQQTSRKLKARGELQFWQRRYYDFNVHNEEKRTEKLRYMHRNPVKRGLVEKPEDWPWSSFLHYSTGVEGLVEIESHWTAFRRGHQLPDPLRYTDRVQ